MTFNEDSRVKIPAILHLVRLGYEYIPRKNRLCSVETNFFPDIFKESITRINPGITSQEIERLLDELHLKLDYDDLGRDFYKELTSRSGIKLIDFEKIDNNSFHVTTELTCKNGDEEFRPDITVLINGMPLTFIEVKKPNNKEGMFAERKRMNQRFGSKHFKRFANLTQLMIFSNNMPYEEGVPNPVQGAYYATSAYGEVLFNYFREEDNLDLNSLLLPECESVEDDILIDNHLPALKHSDEFQTNKHYNTPTHRILTSLLSRERLAFMLLYGIAYVEENSDGIVSIQKHIMRYPQVFATKAISTKLDAGMTKGIIWHTQGSGKTALAYFNVRHLTDYYQRKNIISKFYFIVDRIDLAIQAATEFSNRGLYVKMVDSKADFIKDIQTVGAIHNDSGQMEISVVNIQKFSEESIAKSELIYDLHIQRIYFLDEAHRSYNPKGDYLANLINSDKQAIKIALTGTPLLREVMKDYDSKALFGDYIHKYYYNQSIADGYTLRLIREGIDTNYKLQMQEILNQIRVLQGDAKKSLVYAHKKYVEPLLDYIVNDLQEFRTNETDDSLGGMIVCDSADQAKALFEYFEELFGVQETTYGNLANVAESEMTYLGKKRALTAALILHDVNDKTIRKDLIKGYKEGKIDLLIVFNMLLTGFDAKRLKKLYLTRIIKDHNLLQTLTRVNRPYKKYRFGYVVDFADITSAFDHTNRLYYDELNDLLGDEKDSYSQLFKNEEEIRTEIEEIKEVLFRYNTNNTELFQQQVERIQDKQLLQQLIKSLTSAKELKNMIRLQGFDELLQHLDFNLMTRLLSVTQGQLDKLNLLDAMQNDDNTENLLNKALEDVIFLFTKVSEEELILADQLKGQLRQTRKELLSNFDQHDLRFISLREELERILKSKNIYEVHQEAMRENIILLRSIYSRVKELNRENDLLKAKYQQDEKYARIHKRLLEKGTLSVKESQLFEALEAIKSHTDSHILKNSQLVANESYFSRFLLNLVVTEIIDKKKINLDFATAESINQLIVNEYLQQIQGRRA